MHSYLRRATNAQSRSIGPFVDDTDFKTPETALTIANTDIKLVANGGASANKSAGGGTHRVNGNYSVTFDATDSANVGELEVSVAVAGALLVQKKFWVLPEAVYDQLFASGATGDVSSLLRTTIATLASQTSFTLAAGSADDGAYVGSSVIVTNAAGTKKCVGEASQYVGGTRTLTLLDDPAVFTMAVGDTVEIVANTAGRAALEGAALAAINAGKNTIADALLARSAANVEDTAGDFTLAALLLAATKAQRSGTALTIYKTDGVTVFLTKTLTENASANPVVGIE